MFLHENSANTTYNPQPFYFEKYSKRSFYRQHFERASFRWFKLPTKHLTFYSSAFLFSTISKSGGELIGQPDQHHRVVTQLPPSLDGGLDGQSLSILFFFSLLLPYKGHGAIIKIIWRVFLCALSKQDISDAFQRKAGTTPQDALPCVNFCPCKNSLFDTSDCLWLFQ